MKNALYAVLVLTAVWTSPAAFAQDGSWNVDASGNWGDASNWTPGIPDGAGSTATLGYFLTGIDATVTLDTSRTVGILNIGDLGNSDRYTLASSGGTLTLNNNGNGAQINEIASGGDVISAPLVLADNLSINIDSNSLTALTLSGNITGTGNISLNNSSSANGVSLGGSSIDNSGSIINQSTGTGENNIGGSSPSLGTNVTAVIEDSSSSGLTLDFSTTTPNNFAGTYEVQAGTMTLKGSPSEYRTGSFVVGDTAAHGSSSFLDVGTNPNQFALGFNTPPNLVRLRYRGGTSHHCRQRWHHPPRDPR